MKRRFYLNLIRGNMANFPQYKKISEIKNRHIRCKCTIDNTLSDINLKWKTTKDSYCEYILTPEEQKRQKEIHFQIISNNNINIDNNVILKSIDKYKHGNNMSEYYIKLYTKWYDVKKIYIMAQNRFNCMQHMSNKIIKLPWVSTIYQYFLKWKRAKNIHIFISPIYERITNDILFCKFNLNKNDVRHVVYFLCMHVWMYSIKLDKGNNLCLKVLMWEKVWDYYRGLIMKHKISEFSFNTYLVNMQEYSLGFCVGLDDCIDKDLYAGKMHNLFFHHIFNSDEAMKESKQLMDLTVYCIRMYRFIYYLPESNFLEATFTWPDIE